MEARIYTLWASLRGEDDPAPWMLAAEDDASWEGDPDRCEATFQAARELAERNDWDVREITFAVEYEEVRRAFLPVEVEARVTAVAADHGEEEE